MSNIVHFLFLMTKRSYLNIFPVKIKVYSLLMFANSKGVCAPSSLSRSRRLARDSCPSLTISGEMLKLTSVLWYTRCLIAGLSNWSIFGLFYVFKIIFNQIVRSQKVHNVDNISSNCVMQSTMIGLLKDFII